MANELKTLLVEYGLSSSEIEVYLSLLRLGEAVIADVAQKAGLPRTTTASILERLLEQGLVSVQRARGKQTYWVENPAVLVEKEKAKLSVAEQLNSRLNAEYHKDEKKPNVEVFETKNAILNLINKMMNEAKKGSEVLTWDSPVSHNYTQVMSEELFKALTNRKSEKGVQTRSLVPNGQEHLINKKNLNSAIKVRVLPQGLVFDTSIWLYGNSIVFFSGTHTFATCITSRHMKEGMVSLFEHFWNESIPFENIE